MPVSAYFSGFFRPASIFRGSMMCRESGTNEIEIMEFTIDGNLYGINVAKVREILISAPVKHMPHAHPAVEGIFKPRDVVITVVEIWMEVSGAISATMRSKSRMVTRSSPHWAMPVATSWSRITIASTASP